MIEQTDEATPSGFSTGDTKCLPLSMFGCFYVRQSSWCDARQGVVKLFRLVGYNEVGKFDRGAGAAADGWSVVVTHLIECITTTHASLLVSDEDEQKQSDCKNVSEKPHSI